MSDHKRDLFATNHAPMTSSADVQPTGTSGIGGHLPPGILQRKLRRRASEREAATVQRKESGAATGDAHAVAQEGFAGSSTEYPHKAAIEKSFGALVQAKAHTGGAAAAASAALGAEAYASGDSVAFRDAAPSLHTAAHEAAHIVQQQSGAVQLKGGVGDAGDRYEQHADAVADAVVQGKSAAPLLAEYSGGAHGTGLQMKALQLAEKKPTPQANGKIKPPESGPDPFGVAEYVNQIQARAEGASGEMGKYAEAKLSVLTPAIPELGGGHIKIEGEGRYLTNAEGGELEISLHLGLTWIADFGIFGAANVEVAGDGKLKLKAKAGEMVETLGAAVKGVLFDAAKLINVKNAVKVLVNPISQWWIGLALGAEGKKKLDQFLDKDIFSAFRFLAGWDVLQKKAPKVQNAAKAMLTALNKFFGQKHAGSFEVEISIGVGAGASVGEDGEGAGAGGSAKAVHGISGEKNTTVDSEKRANKFAVEAHVKVKEAEGKIGYLYESDQNGEGSTVLSFEGAFQAPSEFDFGESRALSLGGIYKLLSLAELGSTVTKKKGPDGVATVNQVVTLLADSAAVASSKSVHGPHGPKNTFKISLEVARKGEQPWKDVTVACKLLIGQSVAKKGEVKNAGVEASGGVGTYVNLTSEVKAKLAALH